jgi:hypothetical protein
MVFFSVLIFIRAGIRGKLKDKTVAKQTITYSLVIDKNDDKIITQIRRLHYYGQIRYCKRI